MLNNLHLASIILLLLSSPLSSAQLSTDLLQVTTQPSLQDGKPVLPVDLTEIATSSPSHSPSGSLSSQESVLSQEDSPSSSKQNVDSFDSEPSSEPSAVSSLSTERSSSDTSHEGYETEVVENEKPETASVPKFGISLFGNVSPDKVLSALGKLRKTPPAKTTGSDGDSSTNPPAPFYRRFSEIGTLGTSLPRSLTTLEPTVTSQTLSFKTQPSAVTSYSLGSPGSQPVPTPSGGEPEHFRLRSQSFSVKSVHAPAPTSAPFVALKPGKPIEKPVVESTPSELSKHRLRSASFTTRSPSLIDSSLSSSGPAFGQGLLRRSSRPVTMEKPVEPLSKSISQVSDIPTATSSRALFMARDSQGGAGRPAFKVVKGKGLEKVVPNSS